MLLEDLKVIQHITPYWGRGHYLAQTPEGELLEILVAERSSESVTSLLSWANALERINHPTIPRVKTIVHQQTAFVALQQQEGLPLSHCIHQYQDQLSRLDILTLFYQLATALRILHDHGLNHANLTLDQMKIVGEGKLLLQGWAPPNIDQHFASRCVDDLKRFKNFFYLTLVGEFPPQNQVLYEKEADTISTIEQHRLTAWRNWYQVESARSQPNLSRSPLLLFSETPKSAQVLIEEIAPYLDQALMLFYQGLHQELVRREKFEVLCHQREQLLNELERIHKITQMWLHRHESDRLLGDQHSHAIERLHDHTSRLHEQLETLGNKRFYGAKQSLEELTPYMSQGSNTLLYEQLDLRPHEQDLQKAKTFGGSLKVLETQWSKVDPHRPLSVNSNELSHLMSHISSENTHSNVHQELGQSLAILIEKAQLPPLRLEDDFNHSNIDYSDSLMGLSELGLEPIATSMTSMELPSLHYQSPHDTQSTQIFKSVHPVELGLKDQAYLESQAEINVFIPDGTATNFTQYYRALLPTNTSNDAKGNGPKVALSPRNFFMFLYIATILIFGWSMSVELFPQWHEQSTSVNSPTLKKAVIPISKLSSTSTVALQQVDQLLSIKPVSNEELNSEEVNSEKTNSEKTNSEETNSKEINDKDHIDLDHPITADDSKNWSSHSNSMSTLNENSVTHLSKSDAVNHQVTQSPINDTVSGISSPLGMVYIPEGITYSGLGEQAYQTAVSYCVFEPRYGTQKRSREQCKRLIPLEEKEIKAFTVNAFFMDIYEVTRGEYLEYCRSGGACKKRLQFTKNELDLPMVNLSMLEAHDYCRRQKKSLPTYQQWLAAARGDQQIVYPWGNHSIRQSHKVYRANYLSSKRTSKRGHAPQEIDGYTGPHAVRLDAEQGMSPFGVAHLVGNVSEWVTNNKFKEGLAAGGSWRTPLWDLRVTTGKLYHKYKHRSDDLGFRCVQNISKH